VYATLTNGTYQGVFRLSNNITKEIKARNLDSFVEIFEQKVDNILKREKIYE
jgi:hypothetical protein